MIPNPSLRPLRRSLLAGAAYDLALGLFIVLAGPRVFEWLGHPLGEAQFHFALGALPLFVLPVLYHGAARAGDTEPFRIPVLWARAGGGGLILLGVLLFQPPLAWIYVAVGLGDWAWAILHLGLWRR